MSQLPLQSNTTRFMLRLLDLLIYEVLFVSNVKESLKLLAIIVRAHKQLLHSLTIVN